MLFPDGVYRSFTRKRCLDNVLLLVFGLKNHVDLNLFLLLLFAEWKFYKPPLSWISICRHQMSIRQMSAIQLSINPTTCHWLSGVPASKAILRWDGGGGSKSVCWRLADGGYRLPAALGGLHSSICWQQPPPTHGSDGNVSHPYILKARFCGFRNPQIILNLNEVLKSTKAPNLWLTSSWFQIFWHC